MAAGLSRLDLRAGAQAKLEDAVLLFQSRRFSNSYYLAGYAVELGLKACIAARLAPETIPDPAVLKGVLSHDLRQLVGLAGLASELRTAQDNDSTFAAFWGVVSEWTPESRYTPRDPTSTQLMLEALGNPTSGVLQWIKRFW